MPVTPVIPVPNDVKTNIPVLPDIKAVGFSPTKVNHSLKYTLLPVGQVIFIVVAAPVAIPDMLNSTISPVIFTSENECSKLPVNPVGAVPVPIPPEAWALMCASKPVGPVS